MFRTVAALEAENARLRGVLHDLAPGGETAAAREPGCADRAEREAEPRADLALNAALWESQAALARSEERLSFTSAALGFLAWWEWDIPADRVFASDLFARLTGIGAGAAPAGASFSTYLSRIHPEDRGWVRDRIVRDMARGGDFSEEFRLSLPDGAVRWVHARGRFVLDAANRPERFSGVAIDISERKAADLRKDALLALGEALRDIDDIAGIARAAARIMGGALGAARAGYGMVDSVRESVQVLPAWQAAGSRDAAGEYAFAEFGDAIDVLRRGEVVVIADCLGDPRPLAAMLLARGIRGLINVPILVRGTLTALVFAHYEHPPAVSEKEILFMQAVADRAQAALARAQADDELRMLNGELSHRLKNTLALVQSIASQTLRNAPDTETARDALSLRLMALGKAHDILLAGRRDAAELTEIVQGSLTLHAEDSERIHWAGPSLRLGPAAALSLSLILHELATNAAKYGALSRETGRIAVEWEREGGALRLTWRETGGPPATPPTRKGFGTRLIERGLVGGEVRTEFGEAGLTCVLTTPIADLRAPR